MMSEHAQGVEKRRETRVSLPHKRVLALVYGKPLTPYHVVDLSMGGLAFRYLDPEAWQDKEGRLDVLYRGEMLLQQAQVELVSDTLLSESGVTMRRRGVKFVNLSSEQRNALGEMLHSLADIH